MSEILKANLNSLNSFGLEPWYDNISREIINNGELKSLVESGIKGVTSNPSIIANSITNGNDYDQQISDILAENSNQSAEDIYWKCITQDINNACEILNPNFVSLEVSPKLFDNETATIKQALQLSEKIGKQNLMIKIPATDQCYPAITTCLKEGLNVNVTLIFSHDELKKAMEAVDNAQLNSNANKSVVFSFFVSRLDAAINDSLPGELKFQIATNYALQAYDYWENNNLDNTKMLWASTSMKDPNQDPLYYVKNLVTPNSVNTMPVVVFDELAKAEVEFETSNANFEVLNQVNQYVDLKDILADLKEKGLEAFIQSFDDGLEEIGKKINAK